MKPIRLTNTFSQNETIETSKGKISARTWLEIEKDRRMKLGVVCEIKETPQGRLYLQATGETIEVGGE